MIDLKLLSVYIKFFYEKSIVIFFSFIIFSFSGYFYYSQLNNYSYTSTIQLHPINLDQSEDFKLLSSYDMYNIGEDTFLEIFKNIFEDKKIIEKIIKKNIKKTFLVNNNEEYTNRE